jgi:hypothetical protein
MSYPTLWEVPDGPWEKIERILPLEKAAASRGRPGLPNRLVEGTISWRNDFRSLQIRWTKKSSNWLALICFACTLILWRMCSHT